MDGFMLSGISSVSELASEAASPKGHYYKPFLSPLSNESDLDLSNDAQWVGNHRLVGYFRNNDWEKSRTSYRVKSEQKSSSDNLDTDYLHQTIASDILLNGSFNINSSSVDAWVAQLSSLRGTSLTSEDETPIIRFIDQPTTNEWNQMRLLSDAEIRALATSIVKQVKLRGPFLSMSDFINRRLSLGPMDSDPSKSKGTRVNFVQYDLSKWEQFPEDRYSAQFKRCYSVCDCRS